MTHQPHSADPACFPLMVRPHELWRELVAERREPILPITGGLILGASDPGVVAGGSFPSLASTAWKPGCSPPPRCRGSSPALDPPRGGTVLLERGAEALRPEWGVLGHLRAAAAAGASLRLGEPALSSTPTADGIR